MNFIFKTLIVICMPLLLFGTVFGATSFDLNLNNNSNMNSVSPNITIPNSNNSNSGSSSGINIQGDRSIYHTLPEYAPYMPNNGPNKNTPPFEWSRSTKGRSNMNKIDGDNHFRKQLQVEEFNRATLPSYPRMLELRMLGIDNEAAQAQLQWEQGLTTSKPIIINGRLRGWRTNTRYLY